MADLRADELFRQQSHDEAMGRRLRRARDELAVTEEFVAAAIGLSVEAYRDVEAGTTKLHPSRVIRAAAVFGVDPAALSDEFAAREASVPSGPAVVFDLAAERAKRRS